jgi:hypothetical protein
MVIAACPIQSRQTTVSQIVPGHFSAGGTKNLAGMPFFISLFPFLSSVIQNGGAAGLM